MLISASDVEDALGLSFTPKQVAQVEAILDGLEADLEAFLKRPLVPTLVEDEGVTPGETGIHLRSTPVREVHEIKVQGAAIVPLGYVVNAWGLSDVSWLWAYPVDLITGLPLVTITYTGGLAGDDPRDLFARKARTGLLRAAKRIVYQEVLERAPGVARMNVEGTQIDFTGGVHAGEGGWLEGELAAFRRWKKRIIR